MRGVRAKTLFWDLLTPHKSQPSAMQRPHNPISIYPNVGLLVRECPLPASVTHKPFLTAASHGHPRNKDNASKEKWQRVGGDRNRQEIVAFLSRDSCWRPATLKAINSDWLRRQLHWEINPWVVYPKILSGSQQSAIGLLVHVFYSSIGILKTFFFPLFSCIALFWLKREFPFE